MKDLNPELNEELKKKEQIKEAILPVMYDYKDKRDSVLPESEEGLREKLRLIKENAINDIESLKKRAIFNLEKNGIIVIEAKDAIAAGKEIRKIIGNENLVIKAKSNTANEINLKEILKDKELVETDLGDFIIQISEEDDLHPVLPSFHIPPEKIAEVINKKYKKDIKAMPEDIVAFARTFLREKIEKAKIGITGANVISADGSVFILENEGNISLVSRLPDKHIILASFDKIVNTREDALHIVKSAAIYGTGQSYPAYVNIISSPSKTADIQNKMINGAQGAKEVYLILIDNGRSEILNSEFKELLYCINCGACINFCPVYHQITTRYGSGTFPGARGVLSSFFTQGKEKSFENGAFFCTTCKMCKENCPAKIDLSDLIKRLRERLTEDGIEPENIKEMLKNTKQYKNPFGKVEEGKIPKKLYCC